MKKKALIGIGIVVLALLVVVPQSAYAQPCTTNIIPHVYNETGYDMDGAFVEWRPI
jgi:septal ring-binding cell division protein DamX